MITTFLHPLTSNAFAASEIEHEQSGGQSLLPTATPNKTKHCDLGLEVRGWTSFHGFTTYGMVKKPLHVLRTVENTASHEKRRGSVYRATLSSGEGDQTSEIPVPQRCHFVKFSRSCFQQHWKCRSGTSRRHFLVDIGKNALSLSLSVCSNMSPHSYPSLRKFVLSFKQSAHFSCCCCCARNFALQRKLTGIEYSKRTFDR